MENTWQKWVSNGRASIIVWLIVLVVYATLRALNIPAPEIGQLLTAITAVVIGNLTISTKRSKAEARKDDS